VGPTDNLNEAEKAYELPENVRKFEYYMGRMTSMITEIGQGIKIDDPHIDKIKATVMDKLTEAAFWIKYLAEFEMVKDNKVNNPIRPKLVGDENAE
jgi:hypothetical protein